MFIVVTGVITRLTGGSFDGFKQWLARTIIGLRFTDDTVHGHEDPRVAAVVAAVPAAAIHDIGLAGHAACAAGAGHRAARTAGCCRASIPSAC